MRRSGSATRCGSTASRSRRTRGRNACPASDASGCTTSGRSHAGQSPDAIVVLAHRDDTGTGPGANDDASGTAALVELARGYARVGRRCAARALRAHDRLPLDRRRRLRRPRCGALRRSTRRSTSSRRSTSTRSAAAGRRASRSPVTRRARLRRRSSRRPRTGSLEQTGFAPGRTSILGQLIDLGFPFTLYEQGPFVARGIPSLTLTTAGERPPAGVHRPCGFDRRRAAHAARPCNPAAHRLARPGARARAGHDDLRVDRRPHRPRLGDRAPARRAARSRSSSPSSTCSHTAAAGASRCSRRSRACAAGSSFWLFVGLAFYAFRAARCVAVRRPRAAEPATRDGGRLAGARAARARPRVAPRLARRAAAARRRGARSAPTSGSPARRRRCSDSGIVSLLVLATNPFALLFFLPPLHAWLWLPQLRSGAGRRALLVLLAGFVGRRCSCSRSAFASVSGSTRRGISSSSRRSATCTCLPSRSRWPAPPAPRSSPRSPLNRYAPYPRSGRAPAEGTDSRGRTYSRPDACEPRDGEPRHSGVPPERERGVMRRAVRLLSTFLIAGGALLLIWVVDRVAVAGPVHRDLHALRASAAVTRLRETRCGVSPTAQACAAGASRLGGRRARGRGRGAHLCAHAAYGRPRRAHPDRPHRAEDGRRPGHRRGDV